MATTTLINREEKVDEHTENARVVISNLQKMADEMGKTHGIANFTCDEKGNILKFTDEIPFDEGVSEGCYMLANGKVVEYDSNVLSQPTPRAMFNLRNTLKYWNHTRK
jgi:hypothetical protein